jgi:exopolysaccharide biosynthesis protein
MGKFYLTTFKNRKEVIISKQKKVTDIVPHGNNLIPSGGYVLSLPPKYDISLVKIGDSAEFKEENNYSLLDKSTSAIMGIPFLIMDGVINEKLSDSEKHARTAIGITENGKIIIVVVECMYTKTPGSLTLKEIQDILLKKKLSFSELKIDEAKKILFQELSHSNNAEGITLKELANFMLEQGCISAINLDGGGSSSLYIQGKYINNQIGDKDEASGLAVVRPVSDAIVFKKK